MIGVDRQAVEVIEKLKVKICICLLKLYCRACLMLFKLHSSRGDLVNSSTEHHCQSGDSQIAK